MPKRTTKRRAPKPTTVATVQAQDLPGVTARLNEVVAHLSCQQVADRMGANAETVRRVLNGQEPSLSFVIAFCRAFGVEVGSVVEGANGRASRDRRRER